MALSDAIDATKPVQGNPTTDSVRENFAAAKSAIAQLELTAGVGPQGPIGNTGATGPGATIAIGTVTTGAAGSNATVTNAGTSTAATLNFTIPRGDAGTGGSGITETQAKDAVRQGQVEFKEATEVSAPAFPTTNTVTAVEVGDNWALGTGSGVTGGYDHTETTTTPGSDGAGLLAYTVPITSGDFYQIVFTTTAPTEPYSQTWGRYGRFALYFRNGATITTNQQTIRLLQHSNETVGVRATASFTHLVVVPRSNWTGRFTLTRVSRSATQSSITFRLKDQTVLVRPQSLSIGNNTGLLQTSATPYNFSYGDTALQNTTSATTNVAIGPTALAGNVTGSSNIAIGNTTLNQNSAGGNNIAIGSGNLNSNTTGAYNIAIGSQSNTYANAGSYNITMGYYSGLSLAAGSNNVGIGGQHCLGYGGPPVTGLLNSCVAIGSYAYAYGHGDNAVAVGYGALWNLNNAGGGVPANKAITSNNVAVGFNAGARLANGTTNLTLGGDSVFVGADSRGSSTNNQRNQIVIGYKAVGHGSDTITLGNDEIDHLYTNAPSLEALSDERVKDEITVADLDKCVEAVKGLPLHRWKWGDLAGKHFDHHVTGFMSDEVEKIFPKAVVRADEWRTQRDADGNAKMKLVSDQVIEGTQQEDGTWTQTAHTETREIEDRVLVKDCARVSLTEMLPTLWGAVQMIIQRLDALEGQQGAEPATEPAAAPAASARPRRR